MIMNVVIMIMHDYVSAYKGGTSASRVVRALLLNQAVNLRG